jgi:hypothetical protein
MHMKGRCNVPFGERHHGAKMTVSDIHFIRSSPMRGVELAKMFDCAQSAITKIRKKKAWRHV